MNLLLKFICAGCVLVSCSGRQSIKYLIDLEQANIKGRVTKLVTETYKVDSPGQIGELELVTIEIFNKPGNTITDTAKDFTEKNEVVEFLTYNKNGSLSSLSTFANGKKQSKMLLNYDGSRCITLKIYDSNDKLESYYDNIQQTDFGLLSSLNNYDTNGRLTMAYVNGYDGIYQISATAKDSIGMLRSEVKIHLTDKKYPENMLEVTYFKDSTVKKYLSYKYESWDTTGNWIRQTVFNDKEQAIKMVKRIFSYEYY
jgi:hypothetical protein